MTTQISDNPFAPEATQHGLTEVNRQLDSIELSETDKGIRTWIPTISAGPFDELHLLRFLFKRATGQVPSRTTITPQ